MLHAQALRVAQGGQCVGGFTRLCDGHHQRLGVGHRIAVAVFTGHFHLGGYLGDAFQPILGGAAAVVAGATGQNQHRVNLGKHPGRVGAWRVVHLLVEQLGHDAFHAFQRVRNGARLLENFLLHVMAVRTQFSRPTVSQHGFHRPLRGSYCLARLVQQPVLAQLHIHHVTFLQVDDLVRHTRQRHGITGQKMLLAVSAHTQNQR